MGSTKNKVALSAGVIAGLFVLSAIVYAFVIAPLIMLGAALLHLLIPAVPAIGYLTALVIAAALWVLILIKRLVFG